MVSFSQWYNEEADIPDLIDGEWVDLETGIRLGQKVSRNENKVRQSISEAGQDYRKYAKALGGKALTGTTKQKEWAEKFALTSQNSYRKYHKKCWPHTKHSSHPSFGLKCAIA